MKFIVERFYGWINLYYIEKYMSSGDGGVYDAVSVPVSRFSFLSHSLTHSFIRPHKHPQFA